MSIISFIQDAGERLFKHQPPAGAGAGKATKPATITPAKKADLAALNKTAAEAIKKFVASKGLPTKNLELSYDGASSTVTVSGTVPDQETREKIVISCGNVANVQQVNDNITVTNGGDASEYYTVKSGDTMSKIAKHFYGSPDRYSAIFEANKPMLTDPDKIYPGQVLRVPRLS